MPNANVTDIHPAVLMCRIPVKASRKGVTVMAHENRGVARLMRVASIMVYFAVFWMLVSVKSVNSAFSRSAIFRSCSRLSAS